MIFPDLMARRAELTPTRTAFTDIVSGRSVTFAQLQNQTAAFAGAFINAGIAKDDRVAVLCRNRIEFFALLFACARIEAILVPLNWRSPVAELSPIVAKCQPALMICGAQDHDVANDLARGAGCDLIDLDGQADWANSATPILARHGWREDQIWYLLYTSGTTGHPKAVIQTVGMAHVNACNIGQAIDLSRDDVTLNFLPLFHTAGINLHTLPALFIGAHVLMLPAFEVDAVVALLARKALSVFFGVPAVYQALSLHPDFDTLDLSYVRHWGCGGAPLPDILVKQFAGRGALVANGMGMTETGPTLFLADPSMARRKVGSVGKPQLFARVKIVRPDGCEADVNEAGELWITGPGITPGYWQDPEATAQAITPDGWLRSGDLAKCDDDGCYWLVGRSKEMFISGAENVYPVEVENVLTDHPAILEAAVLGVPDSRWGEVGHAYVRLRPKSQMPTHDDLVAWCRHRLANYKVPRQFVAIDDFPRTAAGKIRKHLINADRDL